MTGTIYMAVNTVNGKAYVGLTERDVRRRWHEHLSCWDETPLTCEIREYGTEVFTWHILEAGIPLDELGYREVFWIAYHDTCHNGYNLTHGGKRPVMPASFGQKQSELTHQRLANGTHTWQTEAYRESARRRRSEANREKNPMHDPEVAARKSLSHRVTCSEKRRDAQKLAGQLFLFEEAYCAQRGD